MAIQISGNTIIDDSQNITSTGNATFAGNIGVGTPSSVVPIHIVAAAPGIRLQDSDGGYVDFDANGGSLNLRADQGNTQASSSINFTIDGSERARIEADGSATFASEIKVEGSYTPSGLYSSISRYGSLLIGTSSEAVGDARLAIDSSNGNITSVGSATFGGQISGNSVIETDRFGTHVQMGASSFDAFRVGSEASGTIRLKYDGTATFAGDVAIGGHVGNHTVNGIWLESSGDIRVTGSSSNTIWAGYLNGTAAATSKITADGSADFAGDGIFRSTLTITGSTGNGLYVGDSGEILLKKDGSADFDGEVKVGDDNVRLTPSGSIIAGNSPSDIRVNISGADGSARFGQALTSGSGVNLYPVGQQSIRRDTAGNALEVLSGGGTSSSITASIQSNGSATFQGGISKIRANDSLSVYAGDEYLRVYGDNPVSYDDYKISLNKDGSASFAGNITAGNISDIKFKENIESAPSQLADISAFELKTFDWKDEAPLSDELKAQRKLGLIAQEAEVICPEMVYEVAGQGDDSYKAINHDVLIMKLLGAVKELSAKVAALEAN